MTLIQSLKPIVVTLLGLLISNSVIAAEAPPAIAARYEVTNGKHSYNWYLLRNNNRIETANDKQQRNEIWEWDEALGPTYQRFYHQEHKYIEYTPGQLKTQHIEPNRAQLASIIDPKILTQLHRAERKNILGRQAIHYRGKYQGKPIDLLWLEAEQIPARLRQGGITLTLKELQPQPPANWPQVTAKTEADYIRVDGSDLGDMETDPFVAQVMAESGHDHHAEGHAH